ncbi:MAG: hypothetical protein RL557_346 [archaeon]|jgi:large subunit ribosomal protein L12
MEEVYAALLLHKLGKPVDEAGVTKIMQAGGASVDESKVKSLVASLKDVDIDTELANAVVMSGSAASSGGAAQESKKEEAPKEEKREAAAEGLSALFG